MPTLLLVTALLSLVLAAPVSAGIRERFIEDFSADGSLDACEYTASEIEFIKSQIANDQDAYSPDLRLAIDAMLEERAQGKCAKKNQGTGGGSGGSGGSGAAGTTGGPGGTTSGAPSTGGSQTPTAPGVAKPAPGPGAPQTAAPLLADDAIPAALRTADEGDTPPFPLLAIAVLLALLALGAIVFGVARFTGWEPAWAPGARHAAAEAGWRASSTWAEFTDFVRLGR